MGGRAASRWQMRCAGAEDVAEAAVAPWLRNLGGAHGQVLNEFDDDGMAAYRSGVHARLLAEEALGRASGDVSPGSLGVRRPAL